MAIEIISPTAVHSSVSDKAAALKPMIGNASKFSLALRNALASSPEELDAFFEEAGRVYNLSTDLLKAVAKVESNFNPGSTSYAGAMGVMQLMPGTAESLGVTNAYDPQQNIMGGAQYLRKQLDRYDGDIKLALAAYNAGPGTISNNGDQPLASQLTSTGYITKVLSYLGGSVSPEALTYNKGKADDVFVASSTATPIATGIDAIVEDAINAAKKVAEEANPLLSGESLQQMMLMKILEMQMGSLSEDDGGVF